MRSVCCAIYVIGFIAWIIRSKHRHRTRAVLAGSIVVIFLLTLLIRPSNDRNWADDQARVAKVEITAGVVTIGNFRNFHYRSETDFDPIFETKAFHLNHLNCVSLIVQKFTPAEGLAHVMLSGVTRQTYELTPEPINWLDPRIVMPGFSDWFAYENGLIDDPQKQSFEQIKCNARIDLRAREAGITEDFSQKIRVQ